MNSSIDLTTIIEARLQLHFAIQPAAAFGTFLLPAREDYRHTALLFEPDSSALISQTLSLEKRVQVALFAETMTLSVLENGNVVDDFSMYGKLLKESFDWLKSALQKYGIDASRLRLPDYPDDFPKHPLAHSEKFNVVYQEGVKDLLNGFRLTEEILGKTIANHESANGIFVWPHHFDMASLVTLREPAGQKEGVYLGVGFSPGDHTIEEPYWYISPYPAPAASKLPDLPCGYWTTEGYTGATLRYSEIQNTDAPEGKVEQYFKETIPQLFELLKENLNE